MEHIEKSFFKAERQDDFSIVGTSAQRVDTRAHVQGRTQYYEDRRFPGMLHLKMVRSPHHHARIKSIDVSKAEKVPGVVRVLTAKDVPQNI